MKSNHDNSTHFKQTEGFNEPESSISLLHAKWNGASNENNARLVLVHCREIVKLNVW